MKEARKGNGGKSESKGQEKKDKRFLVYGIQGQMNVCVCLI